jgi:hypothetical protein
MVVYGEETMIISRSSRSSNGCSDDGRVRQALGIHIAEFQWHHFAHLTFAKPVGDITAGLVFENRWIRRLSQIARMRVLYAYSQERGRNERWHLHALVYGTKHLVPNQLEKAWRFGRAQVDPYRRFHGAEGYLVKCQGGLEGWWDQSTTLPPKWRSL